MASPTLELLRNPDNALAALAPALVDGHIALLLGAGCSQGVGLPSWGELVTGCEKKVGLVPGPTTATGQQYMQRMDVVRAHLEATDFNAFVRDALYGNQLLSAGTYSEAILDSPLLRSLGAVVMSSARGNVGDVFTLNFDDVLDWYLHLHGFRTQVVAELPALLNANVDVRIHHFHGYLPLNSTSDGPAADIVLTENQLVQRLADDASTPWPTVIGASLLSKLLLIVGTSMADLDVKTFLARAQRHIGGGRPLGFALGTDWDRAASSQLLDYGVVPVSFDTTDDIPPFLLALCQRAAAIHAGPR